MSAPLLPLARKISFHQHMSAFYFRCAERTRGRRNQTAYNYNVALARHHASQAMAGLFRLLEEK